MGDTIKQICRETPVPSSRHVSKKFRKIILVREAKVLISLSVAVSLPLAFAANESACGVYTGCAREFYKAADSRKLRLFLGGPTFLGTRS